MDIHKPKPWHGWREFLKEYVIIVVGVLTALGAEQAVQAVDWNRRVEDAERAMRAELLLDARNAFRELSNVNCATDQFEARRAALIRNRDEGAPAPALPLYYRPFGAWTFDTWDAARLQIIGHISSERLQDYSRAFNMAIAFREGQRRGLELTAGMDTMAVNGGAISPSERDRLFLAIQQTEEQSRRNDLAAFRFLEGARRLGVSLGDKEKREVLGFGHQACVVDPTPWLNDRDRAAKWLVTHTGAP
jgi:hypothetical protein